MVDDHVGRNAILELQRQVADLQRQCLSYSVHPAILQQVEDLRLMLEEELGDAREDVGVTAQVSIYPLGQASLSPVINEALSIFRKYGLEVVPGSMSTVIAGSSGVVWNVLRNVFSMAVSHGETVLIVTVSNACPWLPHPDGTV